MAGVAGVAVKSDGLRGCAGRLDVRALTMELAEALRLEEYKALKAEILGHQREEGIWLTGIVTATGVVLGVSITAGSVAPLLLIPAVAMAAAARVSAMRHVVYRIASYIAVFYERPDAVRESPGGVGPMRGFAGPTWETALVEFRRCEDTESAASLSIGKVLGVSLASAVVIGALLFALKLMEGSPAGETPREEGLMVWALMPSAAWLDLGALLGVIGWAAWVWLRHRHGLTTGAVTDEIQTRLRTWQRVRDEHREWWWDRLKTTDSEKP